MEECLRDDEDHQNQGDVVVGEDDDHAGKTDGGAPALGFHDDSTHYQTLGVSRNGSRKSVDPQAVGTSGFY